MKKCNVIIALCLSIVMLLTACGKTSVTSSGSTASKSDSNVSKADDAITDSNGDSQADVDSTPTTENNGSQTDDNIIQTGSSSTSTDNSLDKTGDAADDDYEMDSSFFLEAPASSQWTNTLRPKFSWTDLEGADSYTLVIKIYRNGAFRKLKEIKSIKATAYTINFDLQENELYSYSVYGYRNGVAYIADDSVNGNVFISKFNPKTHPANVGIDYSFSGAPSQDTIEKYLSRGATCYLLDSTGGLFEFKENLRMLLYTGTKYVQRAYCGDAWIIGAETAELFPTVQSYIEEAHTYDPDIIFEAGVYEIVNDGVKEFKIPAYVFEAFGLPVEDRCFDWEKMVYEDGHHRDVLGTGNHAPDMSRIETQMWFYYRSTVFIDMGFESIHLGSTPSMNDVDANQGYKGWKTVTDKIHEYDKTHARRGWVLLNAHATDMKTYDNELLFDFYAWVLGADVPEGQTAGAATIDHPQKLEINLDKNPYSIFGKTTGGKHPCGYTVDRALYVVEFDNYGLMKDKLDQPALGNGGMYPWGYDEISWFLQQPDNYRRYFLNYAYTRIKTIDSYYGHITMPLLRTGGGVSSYYANIADFCYLTAGSNDEETVRNIFVNDNKSNSNGTKK